MSDNPIKRKMINMLTDDTIDCIRCGKKDVFAGIIYLNKNSGIGVEMFQFGANSLEYITWALINNETVLYDDISYNDGLSKDDFINWFLNYELIEPFAIIHFTNFRYGKEDTA